MHILKLVFFCWPEKLIALYVFKKSIFSFLNAYLHTLKFVEHFQAPQVCKDFSIRVE